MHLPKPFQWDPAVQGSISAFIQSVDLADIISTDEDGRPIHAPTPMLLDGEAAEGQGALIGHLAVVDPVAKAIRAGRPLLVVLRGPEHYISPDWYTGLIDQVPTWNYMKVEVSGTPVALTDPDDALVVLERLSERFETRLLPKKLWTHHKMSDGLARRMLRGLQAFRLPIERLEAKAKLNQNKTPDAIQGAITGLRGVATPAAHALADEMTKLPLQPVEA